MRLSRPQLFAAVITGIVALGAVANALAPAIQGSGLQITPGASSPIAATKNGIWVDSGTPNVLKFRKTDGSDTSLGAGGGGSSTLATAYSTGASQTDSTMLLDSTRLGVRIRDNAAPIGSLFSIQNSAGSTSYLGVTPTATTLAGNLLFDASNTRDVGAAGGAAAHVYTVEVDSGGTSDLLFQTNNFDRLNLGRTTSNTLTSGVADGASAVGNVINTFSSYVTAGAKILSIQTGAAERLFIDYTGQINSTWARAISTAQTPGLTLANTTAATTGAQQFSPMSWLYGQRYSGSVTKQVGYGWQADSATNGTDAGNMSLWSSYDGTATKRLTFGLDTVFGAGWQLLQLVDGSTFEIFDSSRAGISINSGNVFVYMGGNAVGTTTAAKMGPTGAFGLTSGSGTVPWSTTYSRHYGAYQSAIPGIAAGAGAGTTPTVSVSAGSTDTAGTINITTGTTPTGTAATIATITFNTAFDSAPRCQIVPSNSTTSGLTNAQFANVPQASTSTTVFIVQSGATALTASTAYVWNYQCIQ